MQLFAHAGCRAAEGLDPRMQLGGGHIWLHDEYSFHRFLASRLAQLPLVDSAGEADLCVGGCLEELGCLVAPQAAVVEIPRHACRAGRSCIYKLAFDADVLGTISDLAGWRPVPIVVPYVHGVHFSPTHTWAPELPMRRGKLCVFFGTVDSVRRGRRARCITGLRDAAAALAPTEPDALFHVASFTPDRALPMDQRLARNAQFAWSLYANATFSLHPDGDYPTRRAFYDAWMVLSIPVVSRRAFDVYSAVFDRGLRNEIGSAVVVVTDDEMRNGSSSILRRLRALPEGELERRRRLMASLAEAMQWTLATTAGEPLHDRYMTVT